MVTRPLVPAARRASQARKRRVVRPEALAAWPIREAAREVRAMLARQEAVARRSGRAEPSVRQALPARVVPEFRLAVAVPVARRALVARRPRLAQAVVVSAAARREPGAAAVARARRARPKAARLP